MRGPGLRITEIIDQLVSTYLLARTRGPRSVTLDGDLLLPGVTMLGTKGSNKRLAMVFIVRMTMTNNGYEKDGETHHEEWERRASRQVVCVITENHNVYVGEVKPEFLVPRIGRTTLTHCLNSIKWDNASNHDSCWRTDGLRIFHTTESSMYHECFDHVPSKHRPIPAAVDPWVQIGEDFISGPMFDFALIEVEPDAEKNGNRDNYFTKPKSFEFLDHSFALTRAK